MVVSTASGNRKCSHLIKDNSIKGATLIPHIPDINPFPIPTAKKVNVFGFSAQPPSHLRRCVIVLDLLLQQESRVLFPA
jgi:hypothetical protein